MQKATNSAKNTPKPEIGGDLIRVHRSISRAVDVAHSHAARYAHIGYPDNQTLKGYLIYVKCLVRLMHAHHITEDKTMFPHLRDRIPKAPIEILTTQHHQMDPILKEIKAVLNYTNPAQPTATMDILEDALYRTKVLWKEHIALEESAFGPKAIAPHLTMAERRRFGRITANHSAQHQFPLSLMVPFLLYNMSEEDRKVMLQLMPSFIPILLIAWKPRWKIIGPFLLKDT